MMLIDDPLALARRATTELAAARALAAIEAEVSLGERPEAWYDVADEALAQLRSRWPRAHLRDAYREPPTLSPSARREPASDASAPRPRTRTPRHSWRRPAVAAALLAALGVAVWFVVRHARRRPLHAGGLALMIAAVATGQPSVIVPFALLAGTARILRRRSVGGGGRARSSRPRITLPRIGGVAPRTPRSPL